MNGRGAMIGLLLSGCATAGSNWMAEPLPGSEDGWAESKTYSTARAAKPPPSVRAHSRVIGSEPEPGNEPEAARPRPDPKKVEGRVLGSFRNTYYDFPNEADFSGQSVEIKDARCKPIKSVPKGFHDALCVQGSGTLAGGATVSFAKRDCECAEVCPRTSQRICYDSLDSRRFPWGRGATGVSITPLLTVAVDTEVIPLNTALYIPEFDGLPRDVGQTALHDGCFIAQDRGLRVKGKHVDVFTGEQALTKLWNQLMPSNKGVTVVLDNPRCARATQ
jgi:3D (Asp-Asp-Asp) domain-containing protein